MNVANKKMSKSDKLRQPKKQTKGGLRKQKMFLRKAIARKLKVPASSLKGKTFEELRDMLKKTDKNFKKTFEELQNEYADEVSKMSIRSNLKKLGITKRDIDKMSEEERFQLAQKVGMIITPYFPTKKLKEAMKPLKGKITETESLGEIKRVKAPKTEMAIIEKADVEGLIQQYYNALEDTDDEWGLGMDDENDEDLGLMEVADLPSIGRPIDYDPPVPDSNLNDNFIRAVNSRSAFQQNPMVQVREQFRDFNIRADIEEQNRNMRNDPDPLVNPPQPILEQVEILERNPEEMPHAQPHQYENPAVMNNPRLADSNYSSMAQNVMYDELTRDRRRLRRELLGDEEGKYDDVFHELEDDDDDEIDPNRDVYDDRSLLPDDLSDRERVEQMKELLTYSNAGKYTGNYGIGRDFLRSAMVNNIRPDINTADRLRKEGKLSYREPDRTYSNNAVNLVRQSNRSMALNVSQLLP